MIPSDLSAYIFQKLTQDQFVTPGAKTTHVLLLAFIHLIPLVCMQKSHVSSLAVHVESTADMPRRLQDQSSLDTSENKTSGIERGPGLRTHVCSGGPAQHCSLPIAAPFSRESSEKLQIVQCIRDQKAVKRQQVCGQTGRPQGILQPMSRSC